MTKTKLIYSKLPSEIKSVLIISDGWLVGSSIANILEDKEVKDYDIVVPPTEWNNTVLSVKHFKHTLNTFGGIKITFDNGIIMDIWPQELGHFLNHTVYVSYLYSLNNQTLLKNE